MIRHTITKRLYFTSLDARFNPCSRQNATYQLEEYRTDKGNIYAISTYVDRFSYSIGQHVDTVLRAELNDKLCLENVIKNACLNELSNNRTF